MTTQHTDGRLAVINDTDIIGTENDPESGWVGTVDMAHVYLRAVPGRTEANARRLVACWNACEGISTKEVEAWGRIGFARELDRLIAQRNVLMSTMMYIEGVAGTGEWRDLLPEIAETARAAIAKAEGGAV